MISRAAIEAGARAIRDRRKQMANAYDSPDPESEIAYDEFLSQACLSAALAAEGLALVQITPTREMIDAAGGEYVNLERADDPSYQPADIWSAMLKAAGASDAGK
jgi:hypothetical protein